ELDERWMVATAAIYNHVPTENDPDDANPLLRLCYRRAQPKPNIKVACRLRPDLQKISSGNHSAGTSNSAAPSKRSAKYETSTAAGCGRGTTTTTWTTSRSWRNSGTRYSRKKTSSTTRSTPPRSLRRQADLVMLIAMVSSRSSSSSLSSLGCSRSVVDTA